ncbi:uncharacterized protein [Montipora foliosa]|uniref:uncharacterized protein n=1 Tax=Montipora foliosa TaxID=591990 RepID=UPI0035F1C2EC
MSSGGEKEATVIRLSLRELDKKYNAKKKNDFLKAWKLIQELPPTNPNSFWSIASYHGMPFKQRRVPLCGDGKDEEPKIWGGYCQHGNVLFPFWHRFYCFRLEQALQSVLEKGNERVALHYWDASSKESKSEGLPQIVTAEYVYIDGEYVPNPLFKFKIPIPIKDDVQPSSENSQFYEKEAGYETCRYPYSGIRSPDDAKETALNHNIKIDGMDATAPSLLQANIVDWLKKSGKDAGGVAKQLEDCLDTTDYNPFSNTTSVGNADVSVEQPHNGLHLAIGGFTQPETNADGSVKMDAHGNYIWGGPIEGANGDMGANEVASLDPVFFLHHSNIDRMLWVWQKKHKKTNPDTFTIDNSNEDDKGTSNSNQGATPNQTWGQKLNENTILYPFQDEYGVPRTSKDCIDIVSQLDYDYSIGSLDHATWPEPEEVNTISLLDKPSTHWEDVIRKLRTEVNARRERLEASNLGATDLGRQEVGPRRQRLRMLFDLTQLTPQIPRTSSTPIYDIPIGFKVKKFVHVKDVNKDKISGSFLVQLFYRADGKLYYLGQRGVLSRWNRRNCANCQGRRMAHVSIPIREEDSAPYEPQNLEVHLVHKDGMSGKYIRKEFAGKDLGVQGGARSSPSEQEPSLRIVGAFVED